jgi:hypothetical protein
MMQFRGDGCYSGDGGRLLQTLWEMHPWREIRGCPGRYTSSSRGLRATPPQDVVDAGAGGGAPLRPLALSLPGKDDIVVTRFPGGGGLMSYIKQQHGEDIVYVHTLNTESGLIRKLLALDVSVYPPVTEAPHYYPVYKILSYLNDAERNMSAYSLVVRMIFASHKRYNMC